MRKVSSFRYIGVDIMKDLIIVGAGGFGREAYYLAKTIGQWNIKGFIDDNLNALDGIQCECPIIGTIKDWVVSKNDVFAIGIASPKVKELVANRLKERGATFVTLIHPRAMVYESAVIGEGCVIGGMSNIGDCAKVGNFVNVAGSVVGQDTIIDDYTTTTAFVNIVSAKIGKRVFIGSHSVILNNKKVGDDAFVCAGSIVMTNVKPGTKVMGYPAKRIDI